MTESHAPRSRLNNVYAQALRGVSRSFLAPTLPAQIDPSNANPFLRLRPEVWVRYTKHALQNLLGDTCVLPVHLAAVTDAQRFPDLIRRLDDPRRIL